MAALVIERQATSCVSLPITPSCRSARKNATPSTRAELSAQARLDLFVRVSRADIDADADMASDCSVLLSILALRPVDWFLIRLRAASTSL